MTPLSLQDSARQLGDVMTEQTSRLQELRRQLSSGSGWRSDSGTDSAVELQAALEELRLALRREKENQELSRSQTARLDALSRTLLVKEELIRVSESKDHSHNNTHTTTLTQQHSHNNTHTTTLTQQHSHTDFSITWSVKLPADVSCSFSHNHVGFKTVYLRFIFLIFIYLI